MGERYIGDKPVSEDEYWETLIARGDVTSRPNARDDAEEAWERDQDAVARAQHEDWKRWIVGQGYANHAFERRFRGEVDANECRVCTAGEESHHPDMVPYDDLPEEKRGKYRARAAYLMGYAAGRKAAADVLRVMLGDLTGEEVIHSKLGGESV